MNKYTCIKDLCKVKCCCLSIVRSDDNAVYIAQVKKVPNVGIKFDAWEQNGVVQQSLSKPKQYLKPLVSLGLFSKSKITIHYYNTPESLQIKESFCQPWHHQAPQTHPGDRHPPAPSKAHRPSRDHDRSEESSHSWREQACLRSGLEVLVFFCFGKAARRVARDH